MDETQTLKDLLEIMHEHDLDALKVKVGDKVFELVRREAGITVLPASGGAAVPALSEGAVPTAGGVSAPASANVKKVTAPLVGRAEQSVKPLHMVQNGWAEEARALASPTLLSLGGFGQNDVPALNFLAWRKATAIAECLDASLAVLAVIASQALQMAGRHAPPNLHGLVDEIRSRVAPVREPRPLGEDCQRLADAFTQHAFR